MRASIFCVLMVAAICVGCVQQPPPPPAPVAAVCPFSQVKLLIINDPYYDPTTLSPPTLTSTVDPNSPEYLDLQAAFNRAPDFFKNQLCKLAGVYIIPSDTTFSTSWGFRDPTNYNNKYVGISHNLWGADPANPVALNLTAYETKVVSSLLLGLNNPPIFDYAYPNDGPEMLLAVLAHEFGHVLWTDLFISSPGNDPDFSKFCPDTFPTVSWKPTVPIKWSRWRNFGDVADTALDVSDPSDPSGAPDDPVYKEIKVRTLKQLIMNATPKSLRKAHKVIVRLLTSALRPWPSLFGAFSANEDFVETFTLYVLTHATPMLTNLRMQVPLPRGNVSIDIPNTIASRPLLAKKLACFDRLPF